MDELMLILITNTTKNIFTNEAAISLVLPVILCLFDGNILHTVHVHL